MFTKKCLLLRKATLGVENIEARPEPIYVPAGEIVAVLSGPRPDDRRMVNIRWKEKTLVMFAEDIEARGQEIGEHSGVGA
jgi:hypothetical protein